MSKSRRSSRWSLLLVAVLLPAVLAPPATAASAVSELTGTGPLACPGASSSARVPKWDRQATEPAEISAAQAAALARRLEPGVEAAQRDRARGRLAPRRVAVPTWVHVISTDRTQAGGNVTNAQIAAQIDVLNRSFAGATGGAPTVFGFRLAGVTRTVDPDWATMAPESPEELEAKTALRRGGPETLNLYVAQIPELLGWAYLPDGEVERTPLDGVVVLAGSLPGGDVVPYNEGDTATHEVGHWLALLHTFDNGCAFPGDHVIDTPYEAEPAFGCPIGIDTCRQPGRDPVENFMDYSDDPCMHEFTLGQSLRMWAAWRIFRDG